MNKLLCNIVDTSYDLESLEDIKINVKLKGFILNYKSENYIITLHRYYPIKNILIKDNIENVLLNSLDNTCINDLQQCSWNELLIVKSSLYDNYNKIKNIKTVLPNINQVLYCDNNQLMVIDYCFNNINHLPLYPRLLYIKVKSENEKINYAGMPVFQEDGKLIGIISDTYDGYTYIIPSYYIIKSLQKECNNKIFTLNNDNITKIDKFNVIDNIVYHQLMSIKIPLDVYFTLEGDENKTINLNKNEVCRYTELERRPISNERYLLKENDNYIVNATLLIMLKMINKRIINDFINFVRLNVDKKILLNVSKNDISNDMKKLSLEESNINCIKSEIMIVDSLYEFMMFV